MFLLCNYVMFSSDYYLLKNIGMFKEYPSGFVIDFVLQPIKGGQCPFYHAWKEIMFKKLFSICILVSPTQYLIDRK
jgi:hypothetical protein